MRNDTLPGGASLCTTTLSNATHVHAS